MAKNYAEAVRAGAQAASSLQRELGLRENLELSGGTINVFAAIAELEIPLLVRPLEGLLGAYLNLPTRGILITTQRPLSIQRFTAAHELGHCVLNHEPSLDDENFLRRLVVNNSSGGDLQEVEADGFATAFLMPKWLIGSHMKRQGWTTPDLRRPNVIYQLSLRLGVSYEALCWTLVRYRMIANKQARELLSMQRRALKEALLEDHRPADYRGDVWVLTERDAGSRIDGSRNDHFVLRLTEHSNGGYLWNIDELRDSGFVIVGDRALEPEAESIGDPGVRRVTARPPEEYRGRIVLGESRPWDTQQRLSQVDFDLDFTGPEEEGLSRAERRGLLLLEAA